MTKDELDAAFEATIGLYRTEIGCACGRPPLPMSFLCSRCAKIRRSRGTSVPQVEPA